jgi:hypothetical protein
MMKKTKDVVVVHDGAGRRTLLREGAALLLAGSTLSAAGSAYADCDQSLQSGESKTPGEGTDSDSGDTADRQGCGRAKAQISSVINKDTPAVAKVKG